MLPTLIPCLLLFAAISFAIQRTARRAEEPRRWTRNGFLGVATISMLVMAAVMQVDAVLAFSMLFAWFPGVVAGILVERWHHGRTR